MVTNKDRAEKTKELLKRLGGLPPDPVFKPEPHDDNFDSLWAHCKANNRLFPKDWGTLYHLLANKEQDAAGRWEPPLPLNLAGWFCIYGEECRR